MEGECTQFVGFSDLFDPDEGEDGFEAAADTLERILKYGFIVQDITRINRQEFDVVSLRDGVIWNIQCKNNFIDLSLVDTDAHRFARYNAMLVRAYERALTKERNREHLLKAKLSLDLVQHLLVSRFPIVSDNPRMIPFSRIANFAAIADSVEANIPSNSSTAGVA
jgi:hypothetical protein